MEDFPVPKSNTRILPIIWQLLNALKRMHENEIVHFDINNTSHIVSRALFVFYFWREKKGKAEEEKGRSQLDQRVL